MDSLLLLIAVSFMFLLFGIVLAWVDHSTSEWLRAKAAEKQAAQSEPPHRKAA
jgi:hypothetical protein